MRAASFSAESTAKQNYLKKDAVPRRIMTETHNKAVELEEKGPPDRAALNDTPETDATRLTYLMNNISRYVGSGHNSCGMTSSI